jgi:(hydroxyamino)benzene mutase
MSLTGHQKSLIVAGALLFLFGLLQGAAVQSFTNPRMALSAHLTAVQSGMALMIAGLAWSAVLLKPVHANVARLTIIAGMYGLWLGLTLAAATGASANLPIAGAGHSADALTESIGSVFILGSSGLMTIGWVLFIVGLIRAKAV